MPDSVQPVRPFSKLPSVRTLVAARAAHGAVRAAAATINAAAAVIALLLLFLLAAVITTIEIKAGAPMRDHCGKCTRCIDACPTAAIVSPHNVDARKCISYWTIEHEGPLPDWIRPLLGDRIFGCDDCLDACPWNRFATASREASFAVRPASRWPLRDYLALDQEAFQKLFEGSPIRRAGRRGFLRNVCTALGNAGKNDDLAALERACLDADAVVAEHAAWAVAQIRPRIS